MVTVDNFSESETEWVAQLIAALPPDVVAGGAKSVSAYFVKEREAWTTLPDDERPDPNPLINAVGAAIGNELVHELGLKWVVASDESGTEAALFGQPGEVLLYPMNAVAKRWTGDSSGSLEAYYKGVIKQVRSLPGH